MFKLKLKLKTPKRWTNWLFNMPVSMLRIVLGRALWIITRYDLSLSRSKVQSIYTITTAEVSSTYWDLLHFVTLDLEWCGELLIVNLPSFQNLCCLSLKPLINSSRHHSYGYSFLHQTVLIALWLNFISLFICFLLFSSYYPFNFSNLVTHLLVFLI